jgi:homoserine kinase
MLPKHLAAELDVPSWPVPAVLKWLKRAGNVSSREFARTWNTGLGMVIVVNESNAQAAIDTLRRSGEHPIRIGKLTKREGAGVVLRGLEHWD